MQSLKSSTMRGLMGRLTLVVVLLIGALTGAVEAKNLELPPFDPANFSSPVDNIYFPLEPVTTYVYEAETEDEFILNEITVTNDVKVILGVTCTVVHDVEWVNGVLIEETDDWYARDNNGNVWYFGEDTIEYFYDEEGNPSGTSTEGSWEAGMDGAEPGIVMLANPMPGVAYRQEYFEGVAEDMGKVLRLNARVSVEYGDFDDCLKTKEWTPLERGEVEHKYYAPGIGLVFIEELKGKTVLVELVDVIVGVVE